MTNERRPSFFERHPRATVLALVVVFALATDVVFAHVYAALKARRQKNGRPPATLPVPHPPPPFKIKNEVFHHGLEPFWNGINDWGPRLYPFITNSLGFMDRAPRVVEVAAAGPRIVFIGDSFTQGMGVAYPETFVGLVDTELAQQGVSVLNAAALSYSPIIYYRKMRFYLERGLTASELVVFIDISDIQDEVFYTFDANGYVVWDKERKSREEEANRRYGHEPQPDPLKATAFGRILDAHTLATAAAYRQLALLARGDGNNTQTGRRRGRWTVDDRVFEEYGREGLARAALHMDQLLALCREHGIQLTVAVYPWPDQIVTRDLDSRQVRFWRDWTRERDVAFLNLFPAFINNQQPAGDVTKRHFITNDVHWNESGHRLVAEVFLDHYRAHHGAGAR
jgi:hypothetical protein